MSYFKCFKMSSSSTIETCAPVGFYVLWYVLIHEQEVSAWSRDILLVAVETRLMVCLYDTVCPYLHRRLAFKLALRLLAIIHSLTTLLDRMAYVTCMCIWLFRQEAWKPCLVVALDHHNVKWWWRLYDLKGYSSACNHTQTILNIQEHL